MRIHFLGIGGSGESAAAALAQAQGFEVTGCDIEPFNEFTQNFDQSILIKGHSTSHLRGVTSNVIANEVKQSLNQDRHADARDDRGYIDLLVITPAILSLDPKNPELEEARSKNIPVITWHEFLGEYLMKDKFVIAVCGTHGKSTTTAMIAKILEDLKLDPTVVLGAIVPSWGTNFRKGKSKYFVVEADEFNDNFFHVKPDFSVVTNIEMDHPEYFKNFEDYKKSFKKFLRETKQKIFANFSDPVVKETLASYPKGVNLITDYSDKLIDFPLKVIGEFNVLNASAAFQVGLSLGLDPTTIRNSLMTYLGIGRRMEFLEKIKDTEVISDFGHHPTEIRETINAFRKKFPKKKIWLIYEPHMFSRTKTLFSDFVKVFKKLNVDQISIIDIYPSREVDTGLTSSKKLVNAVSKKNVSYLGPKDQVGVFAKLAASKFDVIIFQGAGDIDKIARSILS